MAGPGSGLDMLEKKNAYYFGTTLGRSWWRRYSDDGLLSRGNARVWVDAEGVHFKRYFLDGVILIPALAIREVFIGRWHAGKWIGAPVLKVAWQKGYEELVSGFAVSWRKSETRAWVEAIEKIVGT